MNFQKLENVVQKRGSTMGLGLTLEGPSGKVGPGLALGYWILGRVLPSSELTRVASYAQPCVQTMRFLQDICCL